jgi:DNA repair protein RecN (Recombination protein N)
MLLELHIENLAIIDQVRIGFSAGLNVLTGETGAGKSIILNALNLILGDRVKDDIIRSHEDEGVVEALFDCSANPQIRQLLQEKGIEADDTIVIKRILSRKDKGKVYLNGHLATLQMISLIAEELLNIYGQHQHQVLRKVENHLDILDEFGGMLPLRGEFQGAYKGQRGLARHLQELKADKERGEHDRDLWTFQLKEIEAARLRPGEEEELKQERNLLKNAQRLVQLAGASERMLYSEGGAIIEKLGMVERDMEALAALDPAAAPLKGTISSALLQLDEIAGQLKGYLAKVDMDPNRLEDIESRFDELQRLKRKYKADTVEEIIAYKGRIERGVQGTADLDAEIALLERQAKEGEDKVQAVAARLSQGRMEAARRLKQEIEGELATLAMERTTFEVQMTEVRAGGDTVEVAGMSVGPQGAEEVEFLISPNIGEEPRPLSKIASGGELSRIMLAIKKILTKGTHDQTLVFDEVDAGIGGQTAEVVGHTLRDLARYHQILCVTHLPQIAAFGSTHYHVAKREVDGRTITSVERLQGDTVVEELARMLGGTGITAATRTHAHEMVERARGATP